MRNEALKAAERLCLENGARLLYLVLFGSELYGTVTSKSDTDLRGIFLPSIESVILGEDKKSLHFSTGDNFSRNCGSDIDIDLWSARHWLTKLLPSGDTGALDLLFSPSNRDCVFMRDPLLDVAFNNPLRLINTANNTAYAEYSLSQAKKYGIKGSRLGTLRAARKFVRNLPDFGGRLEPYMDDIVRACDGKFCENNGEFLALCGKMHHKGVPMAEFSARLDADVARYGTRADEAQRNHGVDYKALSHALRALDQMEELFDTGKIVFPLATREKLVRVKRGEIPWPELEQVILARLAEVDAKRANALYVGVYDEAFAKKILLDCYGRGETEALSGDVADEIRKKLLEMEHGHNVKKSFTPPRPEAGHRAS